MKFSFSKKNVLIISPDAWGSNMLSKHHYAQVLAELGNNVYFLDPPADRNHITAINKGLWLVESKATIKGLRFLPPQIRSRLISRQIARIMDLCQCQFHVIWSFDSSRLFDFSRISSSILTIAHIVDLTENFQRKALVKTARIVFGASEFILDSISNYNTNSFKITHGFRQYTNQTQTVSLDPGGSLKIGYLGNLSSKYVDWRTILALVNRNPKCMFYFWGPESDRKLGVYHDDQQIREEVKNRKNCRFPGALKPELVTDHLSECDILLNVYKSHAYGPQLANPHKLMQYLGSGPVILSSFTSEYQDRSDLIVMVTNQEEFLDKFQELVQNIDSYNTPYAKEARCQFALSNTYNRQVSRIENLINSHAYG